MMSEMLRNDLLVFFKISLSIAVANLFWLFLPSGLLDLVLWLILAGTGIAFFAVQPLVGCLFRAREHRHDHDSGGCDDLFGLFFVFGIAGLVVALIDMNPSDMQLLFVGSTAFIAFGSVLDIMLEARIHSGHDTQTHQHVNT